MLIAFIVSISILNPYFSEARAARTACLPLSSVIPTRGKRLGEWVKWRAKGALTRLEKKFEATEGKIAGATLAAPHDPKGEYQYFWIRDNGIVEKEVQHRRDIVAKYIEFCKSNLTAVTKEGPGEVKFYPDGTAFLEPWLRPQRDGSAYRAHRWMDEIDYLLKQGNLEQAKIHYQPDLKNVSVKWDLEYMAHHWGEASADLWEEESGLHAHTLLMLQSALDRGARMAAIFEKGGIKSKAYKEYMKESQKITEYLNRKAWDAEAGYIRSTTKHMGGFVQKKKPLDMGFIVGVLHASEANAGGKVAFKISDDRVMATMAKAEEGFSASFRVNERFKDPKYKGACALGRYEEDIFHGGNPWMITTQTAAEYHYRLAQELAENKIIRITNTNQHFYSRLFDKSISKLPVGTVITDQSPEFFNIITALKSKGDAYLKVVRELTPADGIPSEQIGRGFKPGDEGPWVEKYIQATHEQGDAQVARKGGDPVGAFDLTWNDASFLSLQRARNALIDKIRLIAPARRVK